jgi:hypothetical protein
MGSLLFYITLAVVLIVVLALVYYLVGIIIALRGASRNLDQLAAGLDAIVKDTQPLPESPFRNSPAVVVHFHIVTTLPVMTR